MPVDYSKGKIYKLCIGELTYVGSTCQPLHVRKAGHKRTYLSKINGGSFYTTSFKLFELGDPDIVLLEEYPCNNKMELHKKEREWIEKLVCVNKYIPFKSDDEKREVKINCTKNWKENNIDKINIQRRNAYKQNPDKYIKKVKIYNDKNKDRKKIYNIEYRKKNEDKIKKKKSEKYNCECGGKYTRGDRPKHNKTSIHMNFTNGITINRKHKSLSCDCGGNYLKNDKSRHERTKKHQTYLQNKIN